MDDFPDLVGIDLDRVSAAVGWLAYERGEVYARGRVLKLDWDRVAATLTGKVAGRGAMYRTEALFEPGRPDGPVFLEGDCSCPVGHNCKHVAAIVLAAVQSAANHRRAPEAAGWERSLQALLGSSSGTATAGAVVPMAIEVSLKTAPDRPVALQARPMRAGKRGWVHDNLSWAALDSWRAAEARLHPDHVLLFRELYALHLAKNASRRSYYASNADHTIDLARLDAVVWSLLDEAAELGIPLLHGGPGAGEIDTSDRAEVRIDVTVDGGGDLLVTPTVALVGPNHEVATGGLVAAGRANEGSSHEAATGGLGELALANEGPNHEVATGGLGELALAGAGQGREVPAGGFVALGFLGVRCHGVVYTERAALDFAGDPQLCRWRLARLVTPAPPAFRDVARPWVPVRVPADAADRFRGDIWPRLRHLAPTVSSDGSFVPPEIEGPTLVLQAHHGAGHRLDLAWEWAYTVAGSPHRAGLADDPGVDGYRDLAAERSLVDGLAADLRGHGLIGPAGLRPQATLTGLDTLRFTTEALPWLGGVPDVRVEETGEPAAFREVGDSLVVGIAADDVPGERDWFDLGISIRVEGRELPFAEVFTALAAGATHLLQPDGAYFSLEKPALRTLKSLIEEARALQDAPPGELRISRFQAGLWDDLRQLGVVDRQAEAWERQVAGLLDLGSVELGPGATATEVPSSVTAQLRPYQSDGFGWLSFLWRHRLGGILADDMGLGKTLQTLAMIAHAREREPDLGPFLVVAPTSVVPNWAAEAARFVPGLATRAVGDTLARSGRSLDELVDGAHVVVTSYTLFRMDFEAYATVGWSGLVLDEAQQVKNHNAKTHRCARELSAPFKLAITGTPMENRLMELWALLSITAPGLFPRPERFAEVYAKPIEQNGDVELLAQLRQRIKPLVKRRTKEMVAADLPPKQEYVLEVDLAPAHRKIYQTHLQRERQKVLGLLDDYDRNRFTILRSLTLLRQLSLHPALGSAGEGSSTAPSAKIETLVEHLGEVIDGGHRALVFSQFTGFLGLVRERLDRDGVEYCYLDGKTRHREGVLRTFKEGTAPVFLISLKAGSVGLNLTEADYCFLLDPWWNPATEAQAVDRTHRIGQTRNVMVYRLIARDTIEEKVLALKQRKAELFAGVMDDGELFGGGLDVEDVRSLFT